MSPPDNYRGCTHSYDCRDHGNRRIWQNVELSLELFVFLIAISKTIGQTIKKKKEKSPSNNKPSFRISQSFSPSPHHQPTICSACGGEDECDLNCASFRPLRGGCRELRGALTHYREITEEALRKLHTILKTNLKYEQQEKKKSDLFCYKHCKNNEIITILPVSVILVTSGKIAN